MMEISSIILMKIFKVPFIKINETNCLSVAANILCEEYGILINHTLNNA